MKIIFFGTPNFVLPVLQKLQENFKVVAVVTTSATQGLAFSCKASPFFERPRLVILTPEKLDQDFINELQTLNPDLFIGASYGKIIPQSV